MVDRITIGPSGSILDWDNWGKPVTDAINDHDVDIAALSVQNPWALKTVDEIVNNSTVLQNDDALFVAGFANITYLIEGHLIMNSGATPSFKMDLTLPVGATWRPGTFICGSSVPSQQFGVMSTPTITGVTGTGADSAIDFKTAVQYGSTSGSIQLRWAQNVANASNTIIRAGSWLRMIKVAG